MKTPPQLDFDQSYAWFFDIDGTLLEFAETPEQAHVSENLRELLSRVQQHADQALALITGRSIASADSLFAPLKLPTAGQHGFERRGPQGKLHYLGANSLPEDELQAILAIENRHPGTLIENKGGCVAVHYRRVPELGESVIQLVEDIAASLKPDYETLKGNNVIEIKRANCNKGHAVRAYMEREPFLG
ncbi:MAG: trehalose-phosphatase, partial [Pseudomonadota bacterium]